MDGITKFHPYIYPVKIKITNMENKLIKSSLYLGSVISIILLVLRHFEFINLTVIQTLFPIFIVYLAFGISSFIMFVYYLDKELKDF